MIPIKRSIKMTLTAACVAAATVFGMVVTSMAAPQSIEPSSTAGESQAAATEEDASAAQQDTGKSESTGTQDKANPSEDSAAAEDSTKPDAATTADSEQGSRSGGKGTRGASVLSVAADVLGMTTDEVKEAVADSKVGDLLVAQNKVAEFKTAYLAETQTKLGEKVADGSITQEEADAAYAKAEEKMASYDGSTHLCGREDHSGMFASQDSRGADKAGTEQVSESAA